MANVRILYKSKSRVIAGGLFLMNMFATTGAWSDWPEPDDMRFGKAGFYRTPPGTIAFLQGVTTKEDAREFTKYRTLAGIGSYNFPQQDEYWFVINHREPSRSGDESYIGIESASCTKINKGGLMTPVSVYRNDGWVRAADSKYSRNNERIRSLRIQPTIFINAHNDMTTGLLDNDAILDYQWHGELEYSSLSSWSDRVNWVIGEDQWIPCSTSDGQEGARRLDAKLMRFTFTKKKVSDKALVFSVSGSERNNIYLRIFHPDDGRYEKHINIFHK